MELKSTLNLPKTDFAMKANLPTNEPRWIEKWQSIGLYEKIREALTPVPAALEQAAARLIKAANDAGGKDNVSVVLIRYTG